MATQLAADIIKISNSLLIKGGTADPTAGGGVAAPVGSLYLRAVSGELWIKTGAASTAWTQAGAGGTTTDQAFSYVATGAEGSAFTVSLPAARADALYKVFYTITDATAAFAVRVLLTGRTTADFPVVTSSALVAGDTFDFLVVDAT